MRKAASCATRGRARRQVARSSVRHRVKWSSPRAAPRRQRSRLGRDPPAPGAPVLFRRRRHSRCREASTRLAPARSFPSTRRPASTPARSSRLAAHLSASRALCTGQWANHEVGTLQPVARSSACAGRRVPVHVDARRVRARSTGPGRSGRRPRSLSAHKIGGSPAAAALIIRRGSRFDPSSSGRAGAGANAADSKPYRPWWVRGAQRRLGADGARPAPSRGRTVPRGNLAPVRRPPRRSRASRSSAPATEQRLPHCCAWACTGSKPSRCSSGWTGPACSALGLRLLLGEH